MLGKLMKYDLRSNFRTLLPLWLTTHGLAIVYSLLYGSRITPSSAVGRFLLIVLPAIVLVLLLGAMFTIALVYMVRGFSRGLLGQEGYLMFTLPVTPTALIASKALSALVIELLTGVAAGLCCMVLLTCNSTWAELLGLLQEIWTSIGPGIQAHPDVLPRLCVVFVGMLFWLLALNLHTYLACSVGQLSGKHRKALAIITFCAITILLGKLLPAAFSLFDLLPSSGGLRDGSLWALVIIPAVLCTIYFFATRLILARRLNLE